MTFGSESNDAVTKDEPSTPGDAAGVPVPHEDAVEGSSETFTKAEGVRTFPDSIEDQEPDDLPAAGDHKDLTQ